MTRLSLAILAALTLGLSLVAICLWTADSGMDEKFAGRGQPMYPALVSRGDAVDSIEVTTSAYALTLQRKDGVWRALRHANYPMPTDRVALLISQLEALRAWEPKTRDAALYGRLGVEDAGLGASSSHVVIKAGVGEAVADLLVGRDAVSIGARPDGGVFVRGATDPQSWLAAGRVLVPQSLGEWLGTIIHVSAPDVRRIDVLSGERLVASAQKVAGQSNYELDYFDPAIVASGATAKDEGFKAMTRGIVTVTAADVVAAEALIFAADARKVVFHTGAGLRLAARVGNYEGRDWVSFDVSAVAGSDAEAIAGEMAPRVNGFAFLLEDGKLAALTTPIGDVVQLPALQLGPQGQ